jgi:hypothetical protein
VPGAICVNALHPHFVGPGRTSCGSDAAQSPYPGRQNFLIVTQATSIQPERYESWIERAKSSLELAQAKNYPAYSKKDLKDIK